jgi:hypothetical protein
MGARVQSTGVVLHASKGYALLGSEGLQSALARDSAGLKLAS